MALDPRDEQMIRRFEAQLRARVPLPDTRGRQYLPPVRRTFRAACLLAFSLALSLLAVPDGGALDTVSVVLLVLAFGMLGHAMHASFVQAERDSRAGRDNPA
ncbi:hypothetical protein BJY21_004151 [Kineosphaera limosa]|uniref:DUF3040 domain-containing protein n=1 Tax=Kineosphaera limosa NBRC 100340 TaxID=1184609 RepID=K6WMV4_9MICO|nr:hypothetical protein [Kineosphaera limosa]NYE02967.1 hypothetical protein [Kineosphaera limosa]GAB95141.1 hypothetical protein KILIM_016_00820 [Kineosphaera limosa NBRC 100340]